MKNPALLGFLRGIGVVIVYAIVQFLANASNLTGLVGASTAAVVAGLALALEHYITIPSSAPTNPQS